MKSRAEEVLSTDWSYWPEGRYGVLGVAGYGGEAGNDLGVTFSIIDCSHDAVEVDRFRAVGIHEARRKFERAKVEADVLNSLDTLDGTKVRIV